MILFFFYSLNLPTERDDVFETLRYEGDAIGNSLLSDGYPKDWNVDSVVTIGLFDDGKINNTKLLLFKELAESDYQITKQLFNIRNNYYVFFNEVIVVDGVNITGIGDSPDNPDNLARIGRVVVQNNKIKDMNIYVWN